MGELVSQVLRNHQGAFVCADTIVASQKLVSDSAKAFTDLIQQKAEKVGDRVNRVSTVIVNSV